LNRNRRCASRGRAQNGDSKYGKSSDDATQFAVEIGGLRPHGDKRNRRTWIFGAPVEVGARQKLAWSRSTRPTYDAISLIS
jgi:hypothetical protein